MSNRHDLSIIRHTYDLILWFIPHLQRIPKSHRFGLGQRITQCLYELLEGFLNARYAKSRDQELASLNGKLDVLRYQTRLLKDFELFDIRRYDFASRQLTTIGSELGGWRKSISSRGSR